MKYTTDFRLETLKKIHFVGIGGIGMSGIAALMIGLGYEIGRAHV